MSKKETKRRQPDTVAKRTDIVGRFLDGEDFILNNPPGFAAATAAEWMKEHGIDRK